MLTRTHLTHVWKLLMKSGETGRNCMSPAALPSTKLSSLLSRHTSRSEERWPSYSITPHRGCSPRRSHWSCLSLRTFLLQGGKWPPAAAAFVVSQLHPRIGIEGLGRKAQHGGAPL